MSKLSICLLLVVLVAVAIEASGDRRPCLGRCNIKDLGSTRVVCIRDRRTNTCTKLRSCRLREKNCERRDLGLEPQRESCITRCRNILGGSGSSGQCVPKLRRPTTKSPWSGGKRLRDCSYRRCVDTEKRPGCWRNRDNGCVVLTRCEAQRRNCNRDPQNQWQRASDWRCAGNVQGGGVRQCRRRIIKKD
ncbi:uncharacterized protein [Drosophila tropicalis]|uniref:uncharacterized protein n=1 Tax=Drosophila tropicalis TaxID=46794 RepID=UPI0035ABCF58